MPGLWTAAHDQMFCIILDNPAQDKMFLFLYIQHTKCKCITSSATIQHKHLSVGGPWWRITLLTAFRPLSMVFDTDTRYKIHTETPRLWWACTVAAPRGHGSTHFTARTTLRANQNWNSNAAYRALWRRRVASQWQLSLEPDHRGENGH